MPRAETLQAPPIVRPSLSFSSSGGLTEFDDWLIFHPVVPRLPYKCAYKSWAIPPCIPCVIVLSSRLAPKNVKRSCILSISFLYLSVGKKSYVSKYKLFAESAMPRLFLFKGAGKAEVCGLKKDGKTLLETVSGT